MDDIIAYLAPSGIDELPSARRALLPSEDVRFVYQTRNGFLIITDRRFVLLQKEKRLGYVIDGTIPLEDFRRVEGEGRQRARVRGPDPAALSIHAPRREKGEDKAAYTNRLDKAMLHIPEVLAEVHSSPKMRRDTDYVGTVPLDLTHNAVLDLNTVLKDQPDPDTLHHEAVQLLGDSPILIEDCLKDATNAENGILFAAGEKGFYWIAGTKTGRFLQDVTVLSVRWDLVTSLKQDVKGTIEMKYRLHEDGRVLLQTFQWAPHVTDATLRAPWILQKHNGLAILHDIIYRVTNGRASF